MPENITLLRGEIDKIDDLIISSLFDGFHPSLRNGGSITNEELGELLTTQLRFSDMTWQLLENRMDIARKIGREKRRLRIENSVDEARKKSMIESRVKMAPQRKEKIRALFTIIHDISVRIQNEIITQP